MSLDEHVALAEAHPHDFTVQYPPRREYFMDCFRVEGGASTPCLRGLDELLLYVHVPFCAAKCFYCNFAVDTRATRERQERYVRALLQELDALGERLDDGLRVGGIDIGGGTPGLLATDLLVTLLTALSPWSARSEAAFPLSIETTPAIAAADPDKLAALVACGAHRISVGVQSTNDETLASVNRGAQRAQTERALGNLVGAGFQRVNADLIFGLPGQSEAQFRADLERVADSGVDSITTYDCLYRGKGRALTRRAPHLPTPADYRRLYDVAFEVLVDRGFHAPYGSLNFARRRGETGTSPYFEGRLLDGLPYVGVGNYASSMVGDRWWFAPYQVNRWLARVGAGEPLPVGDAYELPREERVAKQVLLSLSFGRLDPRRFEAAHGVSLDRACGPAVARALERGWLERHEGGELRVAPGQFGALPQLRSLFYTERAVAWLGRHGPALPQADVA